MRRPAAATPPESSDSGGVLHLTAASYSHETFFYGSEPVLLPLLSTGKTRPLRTAGTSAVLFLILLKFLLNFRHPLRLLD